ncbi:MAG: AAA family ATPase [Defluviitaleaceae bacterium]|nr:AAA family ATPase [Defluviitaleaceae bacterium]
MIEALMNTALITISHKNIPTPHHPQKATSYPTAEPNKLTTIDYSTLMKQEYAPLKYAINDILPQGLFILAGAPKIGESWLILDMCRSIASGNNLTIGQAYLDENEELQQEITIYYKFVGKFNI